MKEGRNIVGERRSLFLILRTEAGAVPKERGPPFSIIIVYYMSSIMDRKKWIHLIVEQVMMRVAPYDIN